MNRHSWINRHGTVAVLLMLLLVMNPELRAFLLLANFIGLDLMIFLIAIQLQLAAGDPSIPIPNAHLPLRCQLYRSSRHDSHNRVAFGACTRVGGLD
jgi:hypothetical protein